MAKGEGRATNRATRGKGKSAKRVKLDGRPASVMMTFKNEEETVILVHFDDEHPSTWRKIAADRLVAASPASDTAEVQSELAASGGDA